MRCTVSSSTWPPGRLAHSIAVVVAVLATLASCGGAAEETTTTTVPSETAGPSVNTVTFDGGTCRYEGPSEIERGIPAFEVVNAGDLDFQFALYFLEDDSLTHDDMVGFGDDLTYLRDA